MSFTVELSLDWDTLRQQKLFLISLCDRYGDGLLGGVIEMIDYIQDEADRQGEPVLWLEEKD